MKKLFSFSLLLFYIFSSATTADTVNIQQQIIATINQNQTHAVQLLKQLVDINSQTKNISGVRAVGTILQKEFNALGFTTYWETLPPNMQRAGNLFAVKQGHSGKRILLIGHLDTVFPAQAMQPTFQSFNNNSAKGVGVVDMKGGDIVILYALKALQAVHALDNATIVVALMGDEENSGKPTTVSRKQLIAFAKQSDVALDFESGPPSIGRRGISGWNLVVTGKQGHSSLIFQPALGAGAIFTAAFILNHFREQLSQATDITFNPALIVGGTQASLQDNTANGTASGAKNVIAAKTIVSGDLRFLTEQQKITIEQKMQKITQNVLPQTSAQLDFQDIIPAMPPTPANKQLLQQLDTINNTLGAASLQPLDPKLRGAGDISYITNLVPANLAGLGPIGENEHSITEAIDLNSIPLATKRAALLIYGLINDSI